MSKRVFFWLLISFSVFFGNVEFCEAKSEFITQAKTLDEEFTFDKAIEAYTEAIKLEPQNTLAYVRRGKDYIILGEDALATSDLATALKINPKCAEAHYNLGWMYYMRKKYEQALDQYNKAIQIEPSESYIFARAELSLECNKWDRAVSDLTTIMQREDQVLLWLFLSRDSEEDKPEIRKRIEALTLVLSKNENNISALVCRALSFTQLKELKPARLDFEKAILLDPKNLLARYCLADLLQCKSILKQQLISIRH
ncbi:MAG: tetratricopeptide repeat protein [Candidatus Melainabacteria bacterium]|nr:MAG: tetratricopeptide repeat protein [Candidatus Melainabacteria bacterium]